MLLLKSLTIYNTSKIDANINIWVYCNTINIKLTLMFQEDQLKVLRKRISNFHVPLHYHPIIQRDE